MSLSHLRPLSFGEILDAAFVLYRRHFAVFFTTAIIPLLPVALVLGAFGYYSGGGSGSTLVAGALLAVVYPVLLVGTMLVWGALVHETARAVEGGAVDRAEAYRVSLRRMPAALGAAFLFGIMAFLGFLLFIVPSVLVGIMFFAAIQAVIIEGKGPVEALSRSRDLARGAWGRIFGILLVTYIIVMIPTALATGSGVLAGLMAGGGDPDAAAAAMGWIGAISNVLGILLNALTTPFMVSALTVLYYDRRVRTEALDLEMATERLGATV